MTKRAKNMIEILVRIDTYMCMHVYVCIHTDSGVCFSFLFAFWSILYFKNIYLILLICLCVPLCGHLYVSVGADEGQKKVLDSLELE